jgi:hypothetical protein
MYDEDENANCFLFAERRGGFERIVLNDRNWAAEEFLSKNRQELIFRDKSCIFLSAFSR